MIEHEAVPPNPHQGSGSRSVMRQIRLADTVYTRGKTPLEEAPHETRYIN